MTSARAWIGALWLCAACTGASGAVGVDPGMADPCTTDADCGSVAPICGPDGVCAQCSVDLDCGEARCVGGACVECAGDVDCTGDEPFCIGRECVACRGTVDCDPEEPICAPDGDCLPPCPIEGCESESVCHPELGACVACVGDTDCDLDAPRCDPVSLECVDCLSPSDCGGAVCIDGDCVECVRDADCPTGQTCTSELECE